MPLVARGEGADIVNTGHPVCISPGRIKTLSFSSNVFVVDKGIHRKTDTNDPHTHCPPVYSTNVNSYSSNVFANDLEIARLMDTYTCGAYIESVTQGSVFANEGAGPGYISVSQTVVGVEADTPVSINPAAQADVDAKIVSYTAAQTGTNATLPNVYYSSTATTDGVKGNYQPTPEVATISTGTILASPPETDLVVFLTKCLEEASRGLWRETGQGGAASNPNIVGIWSNLGYPSSGAWLSDQTAWCAGFMNFALKSTGYRYVQSAAALAITQTPEKWNAVQIPKTEAQPGDIAFWSYRHVNFVYKKQNNKFSFVGGNQSPKGGSNNPNDGDLTESYPNGTLATNPNWISCWRPSKS